MWVGLDIHCQAGLQSTPISNRTGMQQEDGMASVREIARNTGLSAATVSRALKAHPDVSDATRSLVVTEAKRSGYVPTADRQLCTSVGYMVPGDPKLWEYDWMLLDGVMKGLRQSKLDLKIVDLQRSKSHKESFTQFFVRRGLRGVVVRSALSQHSIVEDILAEQFPCVVVAERFENREDVNYVSCDSSGETTNAVNHLSDLGHQRMALVIHRRADSDHLDRQRGFLEGCDTRDIAPEKRTVIRIDANIEGGRTALNRLMSLTEPPTAIVFTDPMTATGALLRAQEVGLKIPEDLSIVGFDDGMQRYRVYPTLTAVCQDTHEIGLEAGIWLGRKIVGQVSEPLHKILPATLEINQTTGVPPQNTVRLAPNGNAIGGP